MTTPARHGFTLIELLFVFAIGAVIASMAAVGVTRALQRSAIARSLGAIRDLAHEAQLLALRTPPGGDVPGVVVAWDAQRGLPFAALVRARAGVAAASDVEREVPRSRRWLAASAVVLVAGEELAPDQEVAWYYQVSTGLPVKRIGSGFSAPGATVGLPPVRMADEAGRPWFGAAGAPAPATIAEAVGGGPGLAVVSRDRDVRHALAVYASGTLASGEF